MSDEKDDVYIMCLRATPENQAVPSGKGTCVKCSAEVWISPASLVLAKKHDAKYVCGECMLERLENLPEGREVRMAMPTKEQVGELVDHYVSLEEDNCNS